MNKSHKLDAEIPNKELKIIIIEDDNGLNHLIQKKLKRAGYQTDTADSGAQAFSIVKGEPNELLLLDYKLPDCDGKQLINKLLQKYGKTPHFVIMTGFGDEKVAVEMMKLGAKDYVVKESGFLDLLPEKIKNICNELQKDNELQQAKKALHETQQIYEVLYKTMTEGVVYQNAKGEVLSANPAALNILGLTLNQLIGVTNMDPKWKAIDENYNELPGEKHPAMLALKTCKKIVNSVMGVFNPHKNKIIWILVNSVPLFKNGNTQPDEVHTTFKDITERKNAEDEVRESEERLKILFEYAPDAIFLKDLNGNFIDGNKAAEELLGYSREFLLDKSLLDKRFIAEKDMDKVAGILKVNANGKGSGPNEIDLIHKEGFTITSEITTYPVKIKGKTLILGIAHDITELKNAINSLKQSEEKYKNIFETIQDVYYQVSVDGIIQEVSPSVKYLTSGQYNREDLIGLQMNSLYKNPEDRKEFLNEIQKTGRVDDYEIILRNKDGSDIICSLSSQIQYSENKEPEKIIGSIRDVTARKKLEEELITAKEKAEESDRLKSAFLANMSHEIRTPMNGILGFTNLLQEPGLTGEEQQQFIGIIQKSGNRMLNTVNDLINISKIETGQVHVSLEQTDINREIKSLCSFFKPEAEKKGLNLIFDNSLPDGEILLMTDKTKFISIITNLVKNAIKYTVEGSVEIGYEKKDGSFLFYVEDSGIGIPKHRQQAVFNRFEQADISDSRAFEGSGLGLAITKAYVEMLGGKIRVESEEGVGSTFCFSLPGKNTEPVIADSEYLETAKKWDHTSDKPKILIAEDDEVSFQHLSIVLAKYVREIIHATNGKQAVEMSKQHPDIDIILLDIKMPVLNGYEAARRIREFNNDVVIIAQTAYALAGDRRKSTEAGCNDYISKPVDTHDLLEKINNYSQNSRNNYDKTELKIRNKTG